MTYAVDRMWQEMAYVAYYLHWSFAEIVDLDHRTRQRVIAEIGQINKALSEDVSY
ncbi:DUF6760 family protein [Lentzea sp. NEAU-D7]|uniref:DUF6760 family protein n=1 Tax=Lentzea sp. NEAU-D7 TaxID=2994667 RepID=UPI00224A9382|nr:DUF6760 family protein [Lentzea sp. NEAU-D7]MCX2954581.1 hypothetical protein [Lentzea sp. NEAU-D7]